MIFVDSNVLIDVIEFDPVWEHWSSARLEEVGRDHSLVINEIVVAEAAPRGGSLQNFQASIVSMSVSIEAISVEAAFSAGVAFQNYRKRRSEESPRGILSDFLIGGHAEVLGATILTRDPRFYRAYFPEVRLITPEKDNA